MVINAIEQIESFTSADYVRAFRRALPSESQLEILRVHLAAPDQRITASQLAHALGFANWRAPIVLYGKFARKLCNELNVSPTTKLAVLARSYRSSSSEYELCLRPSVIEALRELGIGGQGTSCPSQEKHGLEDMQHFYIEVSQSLRDSHSSRQARLVTAPKLPERISITSTSFRRNPDVVAEVLLRAEGKCENCLKPAPFARASDGTPYLEVHHRVMLAAGGEDTTVNAIALCPNCHRAAHYA